MSQKAIKKRTIENLRSSPQLKHQTQSYAVSETEKENTQSKKLPKWVLPLNKFIALPNGLRVKSHSDPSDSSSPPRGRSVPLKAVPLDDSISTGIVSDDQLHVYISSPRDTPIQPDPFIAVDRDFQTSTPLSATPDISGASTPRGIITPRGSLSSADSAKGRISKYRQRSSSTPPDFGRRQPLPEKLGLGNGLTDRSGTDQTNNGWFNANLDVFNDSTTTVSTESSLDTIDQADNFISSFNRERSVSFGGHTSSAGPSSDLRFCFDFSHIPAGQKVIVTPHYAPPHNSSIIKHPKGSDMDKISMESGRGIVNDMAHPNGSIPGDHSVLIYRPSNSNEVIMMGNHAEPWQNNSGYELRTLGRKDHTNLLHARATFSSMPTVLSSKGDKKLLKILKKQEKDERKRIEKEEKKRAKEEKKRRKLEQKLLNKTLPRNWNYVNRPIESVYSRQKLSFSTVPIDFEDGPRNSPPPTTAPPPPPQPSLRTRSFYSSAPDLLRLEQIYGGAPVSSRVR
ncbi:hypothetical protein CHS0354_018724 [Potamilus streckersoni]|uniref:Uncharacterized protein n=1 Tax=Potamilus streckersoni TaxID=2493646 RepID=A0AAE0T3U7_9BIVA|nr:hypothetical protein CHS0354_018724 [Potamilus streckersoni]